MSLFVLGLFVEANGQPANKNGMVATVHPLATQAGIHAMKRGGNAVDAAVAAGLTLGVVDGFNSGLGGGCFMVIRERDGTISTIDGRETAPAAATRDMFIRDGGADPELSRTGPLAVGTPGALSAYHLAITRFGRLSLKDLLLPAAAIAEAGFEIDEVYHGRLKSAVNEIKEFPSTATIFLNHTMEPWPVGTRLVQTDLARSYRAIAGQGIGWFYRGPFAKKCDAWMRANDGLLRASDFAAFSAKHRQPIRSTYRGYEIVGFSPPSSGGVHVSQILNILEHFDLRKMGRDSAELVHIVAEAMKLAFADRAYWLGDPDFVKVPKGLVSKSYAARIAARINSDNVLLIKQHDTPADFESEVFGKHTTHFSTADADGNWVACTATINTTFGSKVVVPGTGIVLNNEMDDFSARPGMPNAFGLVGAEANAVAPGKRPLSSMSPTIVLKDGQPILAVGAAGGPTIISQTLLAIINIVDFDMNVASAVSKFRFHHQWKPDVLRIESKAPKDLVDELRNKGHRVEEIDRLGVTQAVGRDRATLSFVGISDPRVNGSAEGW